MPLVRARSTSLPTQTTGSGKTRRYGQILEDIQRSQPRRSLFGATSPSTLSQAFFPELLKIIALNDPILAIPAARLLSADADPADGQVRNGIIEFIRKFADVPAHTSQVVTVIRRLPGTAEYAAGIIQSLGAEFSRPEVAAAVGDYFTLRLDETKLTAEVRAAIEKGPRVIREDMQVMSLYNLRSRMEPFLATLLRYRFSREKTRFIATARQAVQLNESLNVLGLRITEVDRSSLDNSERYTFRFRGDSSGQITSADVTIEIPDNRQFAEATSLLLVAGKSYRVAAFELAEDSALELRFVESK